MHKNNQTIHGGLRGTRINLSSDPSSIQSPLLTTWTSKSQYRMVKIIHAKRTSSERPIFRSPLAGQFLTQSGWVLPMTAGRFADPNFRGGKIVLLAGTDEFSFCLTSPPYRACIFTRCTHDEKWGEGGRECLLRLNEYRPREACCPPPSSVDETVLDLELTIDGVFRLSPAGSWLFP